MNERFQPLLELLKSAGSGTKAVALMVGLLIVLVLGGSAWFANQPDFQLLYSKLDDHEYARVTSALSEAGIEFDTSQPPGPFNIFVDRTNRHRAMMETALAGALIPTERGISTGESSVFMSGGERQQALRKREWSDAEGMLEQLDFVSSARVGTNDTGRTPIRDGDPLTASVTLQLNGSTELTRDQAKTVARLVRFRLGVGEQNLVISDQSGNSLWDGNDENESDLTGNNWREIQKDNDEGLEKAANALLTEILGPSKARVSVVSSWNTDRQSITSVTTDPDSAVPISEESMSTKTPQLGGSSGAGGVAGTGSNLDTGFGTDSTGVPLGGGTAATDSDPPVATDTTTRTEYMVDQVTTQSVRLAPVLTRLSVSLFLDESIPEEKEAQLVQAVKAAVGFDEVRGDQFAPMRIPFAVAEELVPEEGEEGEAAEGPSEPNPMIETLLERGVEILAALAFIIVVLKSLKGPKQKSKKEEQEEAVAAAAAEPEIEIDPEELARARIEELVKTDPAKVGSILSSWAAQDKKLAGSAR